MGYERRAPLCRKGIPLHEITQFHSTSSFLPSFGFAPAKREPAILSFVFIQLFFSLIQLVCLCLRERRRMKQREEWIEWEWEAKHITIHRGKWNSKNFIRAGHNHKSFILHLLHSNKFNKLNLFFISSTKNEWFVEEIKNIL